MSSWWDLVVRYGLLALLILDLVAGVVLWVPATWHFFAMLRRDQSARKYHQTRFIFFFAVFWGCWILSWLLFTVLDR
jgi:uncharacterized membrane-anchored protein